MHSNEAKVPMSRPDVGIPVYVAAGVQVILAPNPGAMTHWGTNSYIVGNKSVAVVDPGPADASHLAALMKAIGAREVSHILVTHAHADHSAGAAALSNKTGAPVVGFGLPDEGRRKVMQHLAEAGDLGGGEGLDAGFSPDQLVRDGDLIDGADWSIEVLHLPGHFAGHLGFQFGETLFSGDHVMDWSSSIVSPPDGHIGDFLASCHKVIRRNPSRCLTGHGAPLPAPRGRLEWLVEHRLAREAQILDALAETGLTAQQIVSRVYSDIPETVRPAAARNVLAHLIDLWERSLIEAIPHIHQNAVFRLI
ncbi:MBL fold metallo-hydrolase [Boseongicola aestuarii]|uniref:Putative metallo-hydrolase n=1 Tax=Boseongicola aestuarii TaxID=1470561 RepID=A0A238IUI9_9RHOB|nr:MBL fold metallo-hydrolase [Boseongicola aestuarii]SMX22058.1 putative metallo-hydrolase [Boseongicola aestuarii]